MNLQWREVECLTSRPHTFKALREVPELLQLIAFTAVDVVWAAGGASLQPAIAGDCIDTHTRHGNVAISRLQDLLVALTHSSNYQGLIHACNRSQINSSLLQRMSPHLRLALAAEVAAGMLCPK